MPSPPTGRPSASARSEGRGGRGARRRTRPGRKLFAHDRGLERRYVAGADEAGRGCLAGPLVAAAVRFDLEEIGPREVRALGALNDSKQQSEAAREALYPVVLRLASQVSIVTRSARCIDELGLHRTNLQALRDALGRVACPETLCLSDGFRLGDIGREHRAVVDGDTKSAAIAAASILAKVTRDRFMRRADALHPGWGFAEHVGYSTPEHRAAIRERGISPLHRRSFASIAYTQLGLCADSATPA